MSLFLAHIQTRNRLVVAVLCVTAMPSPHARAQTSSAPAQSQASEQARVAFAHGMPHLDGNHLKATIVEVTYGPGESSPPHSHPCPVIGYVIAGSLRTQVKGEREVVYHAGQSFYEAPNGVHQVSANASAKSPVKFLAYFVCDHETELSVAPPLDKGGK